MRIIAIADTHIPARAPDLPEELTRVLEAADAVLHAGDITNMPTLTYLQTLPRFTGVAGNMDVPEVRGCLRETEVLELEGVRIGLMHGWGAPDSLPRKLLDHLTGERLDGIVFGHSHQALNERVGDVLLFNPGSPTDGVFAPFRSYGILTIEAGRLSGEIVRLSAPASGGGS